MKWYQYIAAMAMLIPPVALTASAASQMNWGVWLVGFVVFAASWTLVVSPTQTNPAS